MQPHTSRWQNPLWAHGGSGNCASRIPGCSQWLAAHASFYTVMSLASSRQPEITMQLLKKEGSTGQEGQPPRSHTVIGSSRFDTAADGTGQGAGYSGPQPHMLLTDPCNPYGALRDMGMHTDARALSGLAAGTLADSTQQHGEDTEDKSSSEDLSTRVRNPRAASAVKRKTTAMFERAQLNKDMVVGLRDGVEQLLNMDMQRFSNNKRGRDAGDGDGPAGGPSRNRRARTDEFNAAALIGSIFMRVQGTSAPAPLVYFDDDMHSPQWFKESIDGLQPVASGEVLDPELVTLESMGKLVDGNVLPATLGEVAAYFGHVLGDPRTNKEITPRVLIAIQCDRAKGWFTYKRDHDNSNFVPVVLCASENGRGLEEVSPAHFEVHRAQCAQKKWRQSFKVLGAQKLHKVTSLAQAALGDVLRHLERILNPPDKPQLRSLDSAGLAAPSRITAATHPTFRQQQQQPLGQPLDGSDDLLAAATHVSELVPPRSSAGMDSALGPLGRLPTGLMAGLDDDAVRRSGSNNLLAGNAAPGARAPAAGAGAGVVRSGLLPGARAAYTASRLVSNKPTLRRVSDAAAAVQAHDVTRGLDLLATAASTHVTSPRPGAPAGVSAGLLAAALGGISFNEVLQLVVDDQQRRQQHVQQAQLLQQLAALTAQAANAENAEIGLSAAATAATLAAAGTGGTSSAALADAATAVNPPAAQPAADGFEPAAGHLGSAVAVDEPAAAQHVGPLQPPALSRVERETIREIMRNVRGVDVSHAVRGILQHVAMQHTSDVLPVSMSAGAALAAVLTKTAAEEGLVQGQAGAADTRDRAAAGGAAGAAAPGQQGVDAQEPGSGMEVDPAGQVPVTDTIPPPAEGLS